MLSQRGDTLIEVIFAFTVFSMLAVGAITVMNQGTATAQRTLEITLVRQEMDSQAAVLRYIKAENASGWSELVSEAPKDAPTTFGELTDDNSCPALPGRSIVMNPLSGAVSEKKPELISADSPTVYPRVVTTDSETESVGEDGEVVTTISTDVSTYGMWIEPVRDDSFIDFHIRACWQSVGSNKPVYLGTIVRLNV